MSGTQSNTPVKTGALWNWNTSVPGQAPTVITFSSGAKTKTGLQPNDLRSFVSIPLQIYTNPPIPISDEVVFDWIRYAEDAIEQETNIRLCQTWIAAPAAKSQAEAQLLALSTKYNYQQLGVDYDYEEAAYDFFFERARDEGWLYQRLRWRPVKSATFTDPTGIVSPNFTGVKNIAFIYPLLNEYFRVPPTWTVEDQNRGLIRIVPATSVQMLPLFAMQLAFMGFAENVPGGMWFQYTAGITAADYQGEWRFMRQLVLARAAEMALISMQTSVNFGAIETQMVADGLSYRNKFDPAGAFSGPIKAFMAMGDTLTRRAKSMVGGVHLGTL